MNSDTIAAIATAMSPSGIGIIRISGDDSLNIIDKIFKSKVSNKKISESLTEDLIKYTQISNWNGVMPTTVVNGNDTMPLLSISE